MCFFKRKKARKLAEKQEKEALARKNAELASVKPVVQVEKMEKTEPKPVVEKKVEEPKPVPVEKETVAPKKAAVQKKTEKVVAQKKTDAPKEVVEPKEEKAAKYHVSQNKDPKSDSYRSWRVRKQGSQKTIKFFPTQKEAIAYAESLADSAGSSVVIHKMDGSIRKQDYSKK